MAEFLTEKAIPFLRYLAENLARYYWVQEWDAYGIVTFVFHILMTITICACGISVVAYIKEYQIFEMIALKIVGNMQAYDKLQHNQRKKEAEGRDVKIKAQDEKNLIDKLYDAIAQTGVTEIIPGFSEAGFLLIVATVGIIMFVVTSFWRGIVVGIATCLVFFIVTWYCLTLAAYQRKVTLEGQLMQLVDSVSSASVQFANIIDIFGAIYPQFKGALKRGLESCYVEAKQTSDREAALVHLVRRYDSAQFAFIIDNLRRCSQITGDYRGICKDLADTISIYAASHKNKQAILRNAKVQITIMFVMSLAIMYTLGIFLGGIMDVLFGSTVGNLCIGALVLLYFYGLNIKAEK